MTLTTVLNYFTLKEAREDPKSDESFDPPRVLHCKLSSPRGAFCTIDFATLHQQPTTSEREAGLPGTSGLRKGPSSLHHKNVSMFSSTTKDKK